VDRFLGIQCIHQSHWVRSELTSRDLPHLGDHRDATHDRIHVSETLRTRHTPI